MAAITIYSAKTSPRLVYVLDWLFNEVLNISYELVNDEKALAGKQLFLSYGRMFENGINIADGELLWENGINQHDPESGYWKEIPTIYNAEGDHSIPFDIFSAIFFFISRYEEYWGFTSDKHNRFPATSSLAYKRAFLHRPVVDEWIYEFARLLHENGVVTDLGEFSYQPTYDIDIAYSYLHKGLKRSWGALAKDVLTGNAGMATERFQVITGKKQDPYDCFDWLTGLHQRLGLRPEYFILSTLSTTAYDKNNSPRHPAMRSLISQLAQNGNVHIHPSYYSANATVFEGEKAELEYIIRGHITQSRQHYVRLRLPETYRALIDRGIADDWSMGFGDQLGFRAGTGRNFYWYDLKKEMKTSLRVHTFCFMDSTAHFELRLSANQAFEKLHELTIMLQRTKSRLVTIFHNFSLGADKQWNGWRAGYTEFLEEQSRKPV